MWKTYFWFTIYFLTLFLSNFVPFWPQLIFEDSLICRMGYCAELKNRVLRSLLRAELGSVTAPSSTAETHSQTSTGTQKQYGVRDSGLIQQTKSGIKWLFKANVASCNPQKILMIPVSVTWYHLNDSFEVSFEIEDHFNDLHVVILQLNVCKYIKV